MSQLTVSGDVKGGKFIAPGWFVWLGSQEGRRIVVVASPEASYRSSRQNRRYWSLIVPVAAEVLSATRDVPLSKDQTHEVLKFAFIGHEDTVLGPIAKSSKKLTTAEFAKFSDSVEQWLLTQHGVVLDGVDE